MVKDPLSFRRTPSAMAIKRSHSEQRHFSL
nr:MAG TPA_asm: hypothetical protein [Caudoviricetes sp.]